MKVRESSNAIAKYRLKLMIESEPLHSSLVKTEQLKHEIAEIVARYHDITLDEYDVNIIIKKRV